MTEVVVRKVFVAVNEQGRRIGEQHHNARFTDHEIDLIRQLNEEGLSYSVLAEKFECAKSTIQMYCQCNRRAQTIAKWKVLLIEVPISLSENEYKDK